ncbi:MAG: hypothetical protein D6E12_06095 [Desulfovibrio sp.]|nr:MAG: hypothetical protein D6E12_06095 [Desulfovibrio sp.]
MQDTLGAFYYPDPSDKSTRMYVRKAGGNIEFRMWHAKHKDIWDKHEWIPIDVVRKAAAQDPERKKFHLSLYDLNVAKAVLAEAGIS